MTNDKVILKVVDVSKQYRLGLVGTGTLGDDLKRWWYRIRGKEDPFLKVGDVNDRSTKADSDYVWALQDINFEVKQGEVLGIIGKNGAGKSTLLKILSRVTSPTTGEIKTKGRIASLLEVGTGFHPELTGRENIYLNGAILGMTKAEIKTKETEIIAFSGCERYVDTPVKRYSSGMRVRLAFAVAAFLEPDILVIDEVLAVGDAEFQKKAIGKMQDISKGDGRTVLFVSHNMAAVKSLCTRTIVLKDGLKVFNGNTDKGVDFYLKDGDINNLSNHKVLKGNGNFISKEIELLEVGIRPKGGEFKDILKMDQDLEMVIRFKKKLFEERIDTTVNLKNSTGVLLLNLSSARVNYIENEDGIGVFEHIVYFPKGYFNAQTFYLNLIFVKDKKHLVFNFQDILNFNILPKDYELDEWKSVGNVPLRGNFNWSTKSIDN